VTFLKKHLPLKPSFAAIRRARGSFRAVHAEGNGSTYQVSGFGLRLLNLGVPSDQPLLAGQM
jgi:hypothetical protein